MSRRALHATLHAIPAASVLVACVAATSAAACASGEARGDARDASLESSPPRGSEFAVRPARDAADSQAVAEAERVLSGWLDAAREGAASGYAPTAPVCDDGGASFPSPLLAHHVLLPFELRGDTVIGRARVTTVAEQDVDRRAPGQFVARARVRTDVLEWDLVPTGSGFAVCNGIRFGYRGADSLTRWLPDGATYEVVRARADSIHRALGAPAAAPDRSK